MRRTGLCFFSSLVALFLLGPLTLQAKDKNSTVPDWALEAAKTPTPADVGKASAVVLFDEYQITIDDRNQAVELERIAVRVLKPQGRGYTHCSMSFEESQKHNSFHAWTIAANGQHFQAKDSDFIESGDYEASILQFTSRTRSLTPPANDPGAVVACEIEQHLQPFMHFESWDIQTEIPVLHQSLDLLLPPGGKYATAWGHYAPLKPTEVAPNHLRWSIEKMPALDLDNIYAVPSSRALAARMSLFWGDLAAEGKEAQWRALGQWGEKLQEHRTDPTPEIEAKVRELTAGAPDLYTKLSRITSYIQKNVKYFIVMRGIGGVQAHYVADIYKTHSGDCKDKTTLLIAMLQPLGIRAHQVVVDHRRGVINPDAPSLIGDHMITAIELPAGENDPRLAARVKAPSGKTLLIFDPTDESTPVGLIRADLQGGWGNLYDGANSTVFQIPVLKPETAGMERTGRFTLAEDGSLAGEVSESYTGDDAKYWRAFLKNYNAKDVRESMETRLGAGLPGFTLQSYDFAHAGDLDQPFVRHLRFSVNSYARTAGPLLLVRPRVFGSDAANVVDVMENKPRQYPIRLGNPSRMHSRYEITLPAGYKIDELPPPVSVDAGFASYTASVTAKENHLLYEREYVLRDVEIAPGKAAELRKFEQKIMAAEAGMAVFQKQ